MMRVSKLFKKNVELLYADIYNVSLGLCSKNSWLTERTHTLIT